MILNCREPKKGTYNKMTPIIRDACCTEIEDLKEERDQLRDKLDIVIDALESLESGLTFSDVPIPTTPGIVNCMKALAKIRGDK